LPLPSPAADDEPIEVLAEGIRSAAAGVEILGWYRGRPFGDAVLTPADVEAQTALFEDRPCIIAVVAGAGDAGAIFRHSMSPGWPLTSLPFYEWLGDHVVATDEPKPSILGWRNYRPSEPVVRASAASVPPRALHAAAPDRAIHPVLVPDADGDEEAPRDTVMYTWVRPLLRPAGYAALVLVAAVLITGAFALFGAASSPGSRNGSTSTADVAGSAPAVAILDRRADTLALALNVFQDRARMFDARQMPCSGFAQAPRPLEKIELIRLLTNPLFAQTEVAEIVRRSCVDFRPTERDWADLRNVGAGGEVIASVAACDARRSGSRPASAPSAAAASPRVAAPVTPPPLTPLLLTGDVVATAGSPSVVRVFVHRAGVPQARVPLTLRGTTALGMPLDAVALSDDSGLAEFQLPPIRQIGAYRFEVVG